MHIHSARIHRHPELHRGRIQLHDAGRNHGVLLVITCREALPGLAT